MYGEAKHGICVEEQSDSLHGRQEAKRGREKRPGIRYTFQRHAP
jgi:hypothetical protein